MSTDLDAGFKEILGIIDDILSFLSLVEGNNIIESDIESIFFKAHYIEQFISLLKKQNFTDAFESKLKEYYKIKGIPRIPTVPVLEVYTDEVLSKILILQLSNDLISAAIKLYIKNASEKRFEKLIKKLAKFRTLLVDVSEELKEVIPSPELECILLVECWLKIINGGKEGFDAVKRILKEMLLDPESVNILLNVLHIESSDGYLMVQEVIINTLASDLCDRSYLSSWKVILEHEQLDLILSKFPNLVPAVFNFLEIITNGIDFDEDNDSWKSSVCGDLDYSGLIRIFKKLHSFEVTRYKLKKLIYSNKLKKIAIWEHIDKSCCHNAS